MAIRTKTKERVKVVFDMKRSGVMSGEVKGGMKRLGEELFYDLGSVCRINFSSTAPR